MLKIWGRKNSWNVQKILWLAEELDLAFERIDAGGAYGRVNDPDFRALNPMGRIPVIEDDGFVLYESHAILRYLAHKWGRLYPAEPRTRGTIEQWLDWVHTEGWAEMRDIFWTLVRTPEAERDMELVERRREALATKLEAVDGWLANHRYLAGEAFTIADIPMAVLAFRWFELPIERNDLGRLERWYEEVRERAGFEKHCAEPLT